jgi:hypothetical protein
MSPRQKRGLTWEFIPLEACGIPLRDPHASQKTSKTTEKAKPSVALGGRQARISFSSAPEGSVNFTVTRSSGARRRDLWTGCVLDAGAVTSGVGTGTSSASRSDASFPRSSPTLPMDQTQLFPSENGVATAVMSPRTTQHHRVHRNAAHGGDGLGLRLMPEQLSAGSVGQVIVAGGRPGDALDVGRPAQQRPNRRGGDKLCYDFGVVAWM